MKRLLISLIALIFLINIVSGTINLNVNSTGKNYIEWEWTIQNETLNQISIDGVNVCNYNNQSNNFILSDLNPKEIHIITLVGSSSIAINKTSTLDDIKSVDIIADYFVKYLILFFTIALMIIGMRVPLVAIISFLFALSGLVIALTQGDFLLDMIYSICLIGALLVSFMGLKR